MARHAARRVLVWGLSLGVAAVLLLPGLFLVYVKKRAEEGTLPLPEVLKPYSTPADPPPPDRPVVAPGAGERVLARVVDSRGAPRVRTPILLFFVRMTGEGPIEWSVCGMTNEGGWWTSDDLPTRFTGGFVEATPDRGWPVRKEFSFEGRWPCRVGMVVPDGRGIRVRVTDENGAPVGGALVRAVLVRKPGRDEPSQGRSGRSREWTAWRLRMKEILRDPDGIERCMDCWTSRTEAGAEEGIAVAGRPLGNGDYDFPRVHPEASVWILGWAEGRSLTSMPIPGGVPPGADSDTRVELRLPRVGQAAAPVVQMPDGLPCADRRVRLLPPGVPTWLNVDLPVGRTDGEGRLSVTGLDPDVDYTLILEDPDTRFEGVTRYLGASGTWRPGAAGTVRLVSGVPLMFRATNPAPLPAGGR